MNNKQTLIFIFCLSLIVTSGCEKFQSSHGEEFPSPQTVQPAFKEFSSLSLPNNLEFCGERISLSNPELRERAEREFLLNIQQPGQLLLYFKRAGKYFSLFGESLLTSL